jgi:O-antigen/teichoic acid export membrane protein
MSPVCDVVTAAPLPLRDVFVRVGRQGVVYGLGAAAQQLAAIVLIPLYTTRLSPAEYGTLGLVLVAGQIAATFAGAGLRPGLFRSYYDYQTDTERRAVIATVALLTTATAGLICVLGIGLSPWLAAGVLGDRAYAVYFVLILLSAAGSSFVQIGLAVFRCRQQPTQFVVAQLAVFLVRVALVVYFVAVAQRGVYGVLLGYFLTDVLAAVWLLWRLRASVFHRIRRDEIRKIASYGAPLVLVGLFGFVSTYADRYIINAFHTRHEVGLYTLAYQFGMLMTIALITPLKLVWGPIFLSIKDQPNFPRVCSLALTYVVLMGSVVFLAIALLSPAVLRLIAEPEFAAASRVIPLVALAYLIWSTRSIVEVGVQLARRTEIIAGFTGVGAVINLGLNLILVPRFGIAGAAWTTVITFSTIIVIDGLINRRFLAVAYEWGRLIRIAIAACIVFIIGTQLSFASFTAGVLVKLSLLAAFPLLLLLLGFFHRHELTEFRRLIQAGRATPVAPVPEDADG